MRQRKKADLLKKIEASKSKIEAEQAELAKLIEQLTELEKDKLYSAVVKAGLTVEEAEKLLAEIAEKSEKSANKETQNPPNNSPENSPQNVPKTEIKPMENKNEN